MRYAEWWIPVRALTAANLKSRYRKTLVGFLWVILNPLILFSIQGYVFGRILRIPVENYPLFLLSGLLPWIFLLQTLEMSTNVFLNSSQLLKSLSVHPLVYVSAQVLDNTINFLAAFLVILVPVMVFSGVPLWRLALVPLSIAPLVIGVFGLCWIFATLQVFFRDTRFVLSFVLSGLFFLTPILYPAHILPPEARWLQSINIVYVLIRPVSAALRDFQSEVFLQALVQAFAVSALLLLIALGFWRRKKADMYVLL